jgi:sugar/nucleoside kinase (ribokinase family)
MRDASVVCAGILVADIFIPPLPALPAGGELLATDDFLVGPGGCAANTAIVLTRLGLSASVAGKVGDDVFGEFLEEDLNERGIDTRAVSRSQKHGTSTTVVLTVRGEDRRFVHALGANADFAADDLPASLLAGAAAFYVGGYFVLPGLEQRALADLFASARAAGARTILDVVLPAGGPPAALDRLVELLPHVDLFLPNEDEARALTGEADPHRQAQRLRESGATTVVVTMGAQGAFLLDAEGALRVPAAQFELVDGSGAGDAFAAGMITGLLEGWEIDRTLRFASVLGGSACTKLGCTSGVFDRAQAERFLTERPLEPVTPGGR